MAEAVLGDNPLEGAVYVFRNRSGTALKLLLYDGQGYWLCMKRLSQGRFTWWPKTAAARVPLSARELIIVLWHGGPERAQMAHDWRRVAAAGRDWLDQSRASTPTEQQSPRRGAPATRPAHPGHDPPRGYRWRSDC